MSELRACLRVAVHRRLAPLFMAVIAIMCAELQDIQGFPLIMNFIVLPFFFFSRPFSQCRTCGAVWLAVHVNPLGYDVDGLRGAL